MESKEEFFKVINNHYSEIGGGKIPKEFIIGLSEAITDYYYEQYQRFGKQYPKSIKRYSSFQMKDLDHPTSFELIIKYSKDKIGEEYSDYAKVLLSMSQDELIAFEKNREDFWNMF